MTESSSNPIDCIYRYIRAVIDGDADQQELLFEEAVLRSDLGQFSPTGALPFITQLVAEIRNAETLRTIELGLHEPAVRALFERIDPGMGHILTGDPDRDALPSVTPLQFDYATTVTPVGIDCWLREYRGGGGSTKFDGSYRICLAFERGGWQSAFRSLGEIMVATPLEALAGPPTDRVALIDIDYLLVVFGVDVVRQFLTEARRRYRRVIALSFDSWAPNNMTWLVALREEIDLLWCLVPTHDFLKVHPTLKAKTTLMAFPVGLDWAVPSFADALETAVQADAKLVSFCGSFGAANASRVYWFLANAGKDDRIGFSRSDYTNDHRDVTASLDSYIDRLTATPACLNLSRRVGKLGITTSRVFDVMHFGRLLVEESCLDTRHYFVPGEHYLEVDSYQDLTDVAARLAAREPRLFDIVSEGAAYHRRRYSDVAIVRHLATLIG